MTLRIAMWSGPRNISTAMMRSWENRSDCSVVDEPFYAHYLHETQSPHPMFDEVVASQSKHYDTVAHQLSRGRVDSPIQYQKLMTHHMLPECNLDWTLELQHCFLIRDPAYVINSYTNSRGVCTSDDIGIQRQFELFESIQTLTGQSIPVIDSASVLRDPESVLRQLCERLSIPFERNMLSWPSGKRASDGVWASHWYHSVEKSTRFAAGTTKPFTLNAQQQALADQLMPYYESMKKHAITP